MPRAKRGRQCVDEYDSESFDDCDNRRVKRLRSGLLNVDEEDAPLALNKMFVKSTQLIIIFLANAQHSVCKNRAVSPFLNLPPEIRNQIYSYVFHVGVVVIRIGYRPEQTNRGGGRIGHGLWSRSTANRDFFDVINRGEGVRLGLLRVCRQIYSEAALLPYTLNKFEIQNIWVAGHLLQTMCLAQRRAMRKFSIRREIKEWDFSFDQDRKAGYIAEYRIAKDKMFMIESLYKWGYCRGRISDGKVKCNVSRGHNHRVKLKLDVEGIYCRGFVASIWGS